MVISSTDLSRVHLRSTHHDARHTRTLAMLALVSANVVWAGSAVASKTVLLHMPPLLMASARVAIALIVLRVILNWRKEMVATGPAPALLGLTGVALFCACQNLGLLIADATTTALLGAAIPVLTVCFAIPILNERPNGARLAGIVVSLVGISVIMLVGSGQLASATALANLLPFASAASFALYNVLGRRAFGGGPALALVAGSTRYGLIFLLPLSIVELMRADIGSVTLQDGLLLLYLGAGCSALAFILCGYGLAHLEAGHGAVYGNLKPVVGVALAVTLLGEPMTVNQVGGGMLVLLGVGIASRDRSRRVAPTQPDSLPTPRATYCVTMLNNYVPFSPLAMSSWAYALSRESSSS